MNTENAVKELVFYGIRTGLITEDDAIYAANGLFDALKYEPEASFRIDGHKAGSAAPVRPLEEILKDLLDDAVARGVIPDGIASRDLLDTRLMGILTPRPGEILHKLRAQYAISPEKATDYFYKLAQDSDYIRRYRIKKDLKWTAPTPYGDLDITINLSKPEKDPKAIAAAASRKGDSYPRCLLCPENEGYAGRLDHPARETIRLIPLPLGGEKWYMQYSPYVYFNEHCIVLSGQHVPMKISHETFVRLFDFLKLFPHYTIGSNADLPIVGGSILAHEHFQGGHYTFAMAKAPVREELHFKDFKNVKAGIVRWPMSVIRLDGTDADEVIDLADRILSVWRDYSDTKADIYAYSDAAGSCVARDAESSVPHNTITPIARMRGNMFELDLVLRNNRTTAEYPLGIFHPHAELHHIKKENIGLIEVMGLAVLPARLLPEMKLLEAALINGTDVASDPRIASHAAWAGELRRKYPSFTEDNTEDILKKEIGIVFSKVLEHAGVFKDTPSGRAHFNAFITNVNA